MPRVNVKSIITDQSDESAVIPAQEGPSGFIAGYVDFDSYPNNMLGSLGSTHEREQGYMTISSVGEWHQRLKTNEPTGYELNYQNEDETKVNIYPFFHPDLDFFVAGNSYAGGTFERWPSGPEYSSWLYDWNFIENYLQYGGSITIFSQKENDSAGNGDNISRAKNKKIPIDGFISQFFSVNNDIRSIVDYRQDCVAITSVPSEHKAGLGFGRLTPQPPAGTPESFFQYYSGTTWGYTGGSPYQYENLGSGIAKLPLDSAFVKNTGDNEFPAGRNVFSVFLKDMRPHNNQYGSTSEFIDAMRQLSIGSNEETYGIRGMTLSSDLLFENDGASGFTFFTSNSSATDVNPLNGVLRYRNPDGSYVVGTNTGNLPEFLRNKFKSSDQSSDGITFFQNSELQIRPGRFGVLINPMLNMRSFSFSTEKKLSETFDGTPGTELTTFSLLNIILPSNWKDPFSWYPVALGSSSIALLDIQTGFEILPEGKITRFIGANPNHEAGMKTADIKESLNPEFDYVDQAYGPNGHLNLPDKKDAFNSALTVLGVTTDLYNWKKQHNIFGASGASLTNSALQYWGCTCGSDSIGQGPTFGIRSFVNSILGITPDICVDFGPKSLTSHVTAEGSTYRAYIGFSKKFPDNSITGLSNIFGEYIGGSGEPNHVAGGSTLADFVKKLSAVESNEGGVPPTTFLNSASAKAIRIYPLIPDPSDAFALTADKTNYFYSISSTQHQAGAIADLEHYKDPNWPADFRKDGVAGDPGNRDSIDYGFHWYSIAPSNLELDGQLIGPTAAQNKLSTTSIGMVGSPGSTARSQFFGVTTGSAPSTNLNGITNEGIHLLAEIDVVAGLPLTGFVPPSAFDQEDVSYDNIFSSNADKFEFPVFGEKFKENSFGNYNSEQESLNIKKSNEIPFTSDVAGFFARQFRDLQPWFSPANQSVSSVNDIIAERYHLSNTEQDDLYDNKINFIKNLDGSLRLFGDKTFADSTSTFSRVNVSNLFIYLKKKLEPLGRRFLFEQNDEESRKLFVNAAQPFLTTLKGQRAITDFRVVCDETNNTPDIVDSNQFVVDIFVKPVKTINFIRLRLTNVGTSFELE